MQSYTQVVDLAAPAGSIGNWEGEIYFRTDPAAPVAYYTRDIGNTHVANATVHNTALGTSVALASAQVPTLFESWRVSHAGITVDLDATSLTNQGNLVACQSVCVPIVASHPALGSAALVGTTNICFYQAEDTPEYETAAIMPNAYVGLAKDGCYMPLKLDANHQKWWTPSEAEVLDGSNIAPSANGRYYGIPGISPGVQVSNGLYPGVDPVWWEPATGIYHGTVHLLPCTQTIGTIAFKNLHVDAHLRLTFRLGVEATVEPGTTLTPYQHPSAEFDREAIDDYFYISRRMKDAYPSSYNSFGKLWDVIKSIASGMSPLVKMIPYVGDGLVAAGSAIGRAVDRRWAKKAGPVVVSVKPRPRDQDLVPLASVMPVAKALAATAPQRKLQITRRR